jgi:hypothetical protein
MRRTRLTVGELKRALADMPDDARVVCPGSDHTYRGLGRPELLWAGTMKDDDSYLRETWSEEDVGTLYDGRVRVVVME